jgi:hypothetical protein
MQSALVTKRNEIERELRLGVRDPRRKANLTARLLQLERDIGSMGYSKEEIESNEIATGDDNKKTVESRTYFVPPPSWAK